MTFVFSFCSEKVWLKFKIFGYADTVYANARKSLYYDKEEKIKKILWILALTTNYKGILRMFVSSLTKKMHMNQALKDTYENWRDNKGKVLLPAKTQRYT